MNPKYKSDGGIYNYGAKLIALGEALQDKRTTMDEISDLAFSAGLIFRFSMVPKVGDEVVKSRVDQSELAA
jgi:hypothetical protein